MNKYSFNVSEKEQPFVSPMTWALFTAYQTILLGAAAKLKLFELGIGDENLLKKMGTYS